MSTLSNDSDKLNAKVGRVIAKAEYLAKIQSEANMVAKEKKPLDK
ncbi:hypothetical protein ACQY1Q_16235 [Tenacibaculum sp. TC6]